MAQWDRVDVDFGEETANFGPRMETGSSLYQVETAATITHDGQVGRYSTVKREMFVAIIFGGFENITILRRFNLAIILEESGWLDIFFIW